jgi:cysteine-rich repeat protein
VNNSAECDDGNLCTLGDLCVDGGCVTGNDAPVCTDGQLCTDDGCAPEVGCVFTNNQVACDDNDACTEADACSDGNCVPGQSIGCPGDDNTCTADSCNPAEGCLYEAIPNCCGNGVVEGDEMCDDGNQSNGDGCNSECKNNGVVAFGEWRPALKCADFNQLGPSYMKYCFSLKGQTLCTGQHDNGLVSCTDQPNGITFIYDWGATWPMRFTKATQDCTNYNPNYLTNFAHAIGYVNHQVLAEQAGNGCPQAFIGNDGLFKTSEADSNMVLPYEIKYWN